MEQPVHKPYNLEFDLLSSEYVLEKIKNEVYAQNLYAALCNNQFVKNEVFPILKEDKWSCTWRYAGGLVAEMLGTGDYLDWYCSGIGEHNKSFVGEGYVTDEIREDLLKLGWIVIDEDK